MKPRPVKRKTCLNCEHYGGGANHPAFYAATFRCSKFGVMNYIHVNCPDYRVKK